MHCRDCGNLTGDCDCDDALGKDSVSTSGSNDLLSASKVAAAWELLNSAYYESGCREDIGLALGKTRQARANMEEEIRKTGN